MYHNISHACTLWLLVLTGLVCSEERKGDVLQDSITFLPDICYSSCVDEITGGFCQLEVLMQTTHALTMDEYSPALLNHSEGGIHFYCLIHLNKVLKCSQVQIECTMLLPGGD